MLKRFGERKQPCLTPAHRSELVSYAASKVDCTGGFVVEVVCSGWLRMLDLLADFI